MHSLIPFNFKVYIDGVRSTRWNNFRLLLILTSVAFASQPVLAQQETAPITLKVTDQSGAVVPQTRIRIVPYDATQKFLTGQNGTATVQLAPGRYTVFAKAPGFRTYKGEFEVSDLQEETVPVVLMVGSSSGPIEVPNYSAEELELAEIESSYLHEIGRSNTDRWQSIWHPDGIVILNNFADNGKDSVSRFLRTQTSAGLKPEEIDAAVMNVKVVGNTGFTFCRVTEFWVDKLGRGDPNTTRVAHTWSKVGGHWQIIGEFSTK
jgi:hypothetical protein